MFGLQIRYLSFFFGLVSILSFFNIIYSYYLNLYLNLNTYYFSFIISLIISVLFYRIKIPEKKPNIYNKILTVFFALNGSSIEWTKPIGIFGGNKVLAGEDDTKSPTLISASFE